MPTYSNSIFTYKRSMCVFRFIVSLIHMIIFLHLKHLLYVWVHRKQSPPKMQYKLGAKGHNGLFRFCYQWKKKVTKCNFLDVYSQKTCIFLTLIMNETYKETKYNITVQRKSNVYTNITYHIIHINIHLHRFYKNNC